MNNETEHIFLLNPAPSESSAPTQRMGALEPPPISQVNLDNVKDFSHVCRTCATITEFVMPIFADEGLQNNLADKIQKHLPIQVRKGDELPLVVCYQCASTLLAWHELVQCCVQADAALRAKLCSSQRKTSRPNINIKSTSSIEEEAESKTVMPEEEIVQEDDKTKIEIIEKPEFTIGENGKRYAKCSVCQKSVSVGGWARHARAHRGERRHSCHTCGLAFNDSGNLARHTRAIHSKQRPHACPTCPKTFSRKSHLEDHVKSHSESRTFVCDICGKGSKSGAALRMHARTHGARRVACVTCGARFVRRAQLRAHVSVHTGERAHACHCGKAFRQALSAYRSPCVYCASSQPAAAYRQHLLLAHGDRLFHCDVCGLLVERKDFLLHVSYHSAHYDTHDRIKRMKKELVSQNPSPVPPTPAAPQATPNIESKPPDKTEVKKPPALAKTKTNVQENEFSDHSDMDDFGPLPESVFEAIEDSQDSQQLQENSNQTPENEPLSDESNKSSQTEDKNSSNSDQYLESDNSFTNNRTVVIEPIDINSGAQNINKVIKNSNTSNDIAVPADKTTPKTTDSHNHPTDGKGKRNQNKLRKCPFCPKEYKASSSYFYHLKYFHKGSKEHECEVCCKKFGTRSFLTQHMAVHSTQYEFECKQCQKQFKSKASLYIHEQTHSGKKSWSCSQCQTAFRWRTHLLRHMKRHAAEKGHVCDACGRAFSVRCDLLRHARTHSAGSFSCDKCGQKFAQLRYLKVHSMRQHQKC